MSNVIDILEELEQTAGRNDKEDILRKHRHNNFLKQIFIAAQDPYTVYYVNKFKSPAPLGRPSDNNTNIVKQFVYELLPTLSSRQITGNAAKDAVYRYFEKMNALEQKWCQRIILKNLRCGVQESTVNKVWLGAIKTFDVALAETLKSEFVKGEGIRILEEVTYPVRVEPKLDGLRCIAVKNNGEVTLYTRNGTALETLPRIKAALEEAEYDNAILDGEAMGEDWNESASVLMAKKTHKDDSNIMYNVFDAMPIKDWVDQNNEEPYSQRCEHVEAVVASVNNRTLVRQVPHIMAKDESVLLTFFQKCMDDGFEGVMLKTLDSFYKFKRSDNILKLKPCVTYEGVIVGHYKGRLGTKREGLFGGFDVVLPNGIITRVGGGFSDKDKAAIQLEGPDAYIKRIVELEGQPDPLTKDGLTKDGKVRFPVFMRYRDSSDVDPRVPAAGKKFLAKAN